MILWFLSYFIIFEFRKTMNGYKMRPNNQTLENFGATFIGSAHLQSLPKNVNWRKLGAVTAVKDQVSLKIFQEGQGHFLIFGLVPFSYLNPKSVGLLHVTVVRGHIYLPIPSRSPRNNTKKPNFFIFCMCFS